MIHFPDFVAVCRGNVFLQDKQPLGYGEVTPVYHLLPLDYSNDKRKY
jgi:hypothetical protein